MKPNLNFDFTVDKHNSAIVVKRDFNAPRQLVWDCYTKSELMARWLPPHPFTVASKSQDFSEGGHWHYAMVSPEGEHFWCMTEYLTINPIEHYTSKDYFASEDGSRNTDLPSSTWDVTFTENGGLSSVKMLIKYDSLTDLETVIQMGMKEGLTMSLDQLETLLGTLAA